MSQKRLSRTYLLIAMNVLLLIAVVLTARVAIEFFGAIAMTSVGMAIVAATDIFVLPVGAPAPRTPYGGMFDTDAAITVAVILLVEWVLTLVRART